jgi:hypothetical protein
MRAWNDREKCAHLHTRTLALLLLPEIDVQVLMALFEWLRGRMNETA